MIRLATSSDIPTLILLIGEQFLKESGLVAMGVTMNPFKTHESLERLLNEENGAIFVAERDGAVVGAIGIARYKLYFSDDPMAMELFWWMHPDHRHGVAGVRLLDRALEWAKESGVKLFSMVDIVGVSEAAKLYQKRGGELMERTWVWRM